MAAPKWFETTTYFNNKLAQMQRDEPEANWTADSLTAAFEKGSYNVNSADSMYTHFEQYGNTATERVSPNQYFDNDYYMNSKLAQMQATNPGYTMAQLETAMFSEGNMSPWTHYTLYGITEGIDPSAGFNTKEYMAAKLAQMQAEYPDENWTMDSLFEAFRAGNLNPIEHYFEYGVTENLDFTPGGGVTPPAEYNDITLTSEQAVWEGTAGNDNFIGTVGGRDATLTAADTIDGGEGQDKLTVAMNADFRGFKSAAALTNVEEVALTNNTRSSHYFNAQNTDGVQAWTLNEQTGAINITNLPETGVTVDINGLAGNSTSSISFQTGVTDGTTDVMTIGLFNVGNAAVGNSAPKYGNIRMNGIENVTVDASGDNFANLTQVTGMKALSVTGDGNLKVNQAATSVETLNATAATGNLDLDLSQSADFISAELGAGNDKLTVANIQETSLIDGGEGSDTLVLNGVTGRYELEMVDVETLQLDGVNNDSLILSGASTSGLDTLVLNGLGTRGNVLFAEYASSELTIETRGNVGNAPGTGTSSLKVADIQEVTLNVGRDDGAVDKFASTLILDDALALNVHVGGTRQAGDRFNGTIIAPELTSLSINNDRNAGEFTASGTSDLSNVSQLDVTGFGDVNLKAVSNLGENAQSFTADAYDLEARFSAAFSTAEANSILSVTGSHLDDNDISVSGTYSNVTVTTGLGDDTLFIDFSQLAPNAILDIDLGAGKNTVNYIGNDTPWRGYFSGVTNWVEGPQVSGGSLILTPGGSYTGVTVGRGQTATLDATSADTVNLTGLSFAAGNNGVRVDNIESDANVTLGETGKGATLNVDSNSTGFTLNLTADESVATINAKSLSTNDATWVINPGAAGTVVNLELNGSNNKIDTIDCSLPTNAAPGSWMALYVKGFDVSDDKIDLPSNALNLPHGSDETIIDTRLVMQYLTQAGVTGVIESTLDFADGNSFACSFSTNTEADNTAFILGGNTAVAVVLTGMALSYNEVNSVVGM